jgi:PAS domain S-box-containing protein
MEQIWQGEPITYETVHVAKDGTRIPVEVRSRTVTFGGKKVRLGIGRDITERKKAEEALRRSEEVFRRTFRALLDPAYLWERQANGRIILKETNPAAVEIGWEESYEFVGAELDTLFSERPKIASGIREAFQTGQSKREEMLYEYPNGSDPKWLIVDYVCVKDDTVLVVKRDISQRKQAEEGLRESEARYRRLAENASDVIYRIRLSPSLAFEYVSPAIIKMTGYTPEEHYRDPNMANRIVHPEDRHIVEKLRKTPPPAGVPIVVRWIRKDGKIIWTERQNIPIYDDGNLVATEGIIRDITDRKKAEKALKDSEEKYRALVDQSIQGLLVFQEGKLVYASPAAERISGYSSHELLEFSAEDLQALIHPENQETVRKQLNDLMRKNISPHFQMRIRRKNGEFCYLEGFGSGIEYQGKRAHQIAIADITERKQAEKALEESEAKYKAILQTIADGYYEVDLAGNFTFFNESLCNLLGYSPEELIGMNNQHYMDVETAKDVYQTFNAVYRTGLPAKAMSWKVIRNDGSKRYVAASVSLITDIAGAAIGFRGIVRDITDQIDAEKQLQQQKEELSDFIHAMTHDLRNRLLSVEGYAELLQKDYNRAETEKIRRLTQDTMNLLQRSVELADAGLVAEKTDNVNLSQLVENVAESTIPNTIQFLHSLPPDLSLLGDREKLNQVFQNLFENAVIHGNPKKIEIEYIKTENSHDLRIKNDGTPISPQYKSKIFQNGFTTRENGRGMGLKIIQKIVQAHQWKISLEDSEETAFRVFIPK